jgi:predicted tellurium resistance membrane protein TerC
VIVESLADPNTWVALLTLTSLELILGIDNIVFIAILADRLPGEKQAIAYRLGLLAALFSRLALLGAISWVMQLTAPWFTVAGNEISGRSLILIVGGIFLVGKSSHEMYDKVEGLEEEDDGSGSRRARSLAGTVLQIMVLDIVFSLDSVITAVGMAEDFWVMATAIVVAVILMLFFARAIGDFVNENPAMKILALSFLMLIGVLLVAEGLGQHLNKGYIYSAMGFALLVQLLNMRLEKNARKTRAGEGG